MNKQSLNLWISLAIGIFIAWIGTVDVSFDIGSTEFWYQFFLNENGGFAESIRAGAKVVVTITSMAFLIVGVGLITDRYF